MVNLKEKVEQLIGRTVHEVVLTVPSCFDDAQCRSLWDAASIAGLRVIRLLNDTTAAAIISRRCEEFGRSNIAIVDVGGGSISVALVGVSADRVRVLSTAGNATLGAEDLERQLLVYVLDELQLDHVTVNGTDLKFDLCRDVFDLLNQDNYDRILALVREALHDSHLTAAAVNAVYVVGGGSRVFSLEKRIAELFFGKRLVKNYHRDEAVVKGAALCPHAASRNCPQFRGR